MTWSLGSVGRSCIATILGSLVACQVGQTQAQTPVPTHLQTPALHPLPAGELAPQGSASATARPAPAALRRGGSRWVQVSWDELPGWMDDRLLELWPALLASCDRPASGWALLCAAALLDPPRDEPSLRQWLQERTTPWRIESLQGEALGLATGYFEPVLPASVVPTPRFQVPVHGLPQEPGPRQTQPTRQEFETLPEARKMLAGRELAWLADPLDALLLQVQGSGRLRLSEVQADAQGEGWREGPPRELRLAFAGHNGHPYRSVGRWLVERGELRAEAASWPAIRAWALAHPQRVQELLWANPRVVFFREDSSLRPDQGPRGAQGVPLTPRRSVAVDPNSVPYGTALWIDTTEPLSSAPLRRMVMAQDTGSAIVGAVRIDFFWGSGDAALEQAGRMRQPLRKWALWPRDTAPPASP